ncbi:MAG: hypothetical protein HC896_09995 [Bacteroidales bacterium]|nr:hypothetical protein [Bacteroidales bacterium]
MRGDIFFNIKYSIPPLDSFVLTFKMIDAALHESNTDTSEVIYWKNFGLD